MAELIKTWSADVGERDKTVPEEGEGHAWIQWKGTDVCADVRCRCGTQCHVDTMFLYFYKCSACRVVFAVGMTVRLYPVSDEVATEHGERAKIGLRDGE